MAIKMILWALPFVLWFFTIQSVYCCYKREDIYETNPLNLVPGEHPARMLGWEQMMLMFEGPNVRISSSTRLY